MGVPSEKKEYKKKDDIMVKFIESELTSLKKEVNEMWTLVYNQLDRAGESVLTFNRDLAQQVIVREKRVNAFELKIDSDVEDTIALYNPVAIDLRFVLAMFKINSDLERLVDFAVKRNLQYIHFDAGWYGFEYDKVCRTRVFL